MHLMHETEEDTVLTTEQVRATFGPPRTVSRKPRVDAALADAVDIARSALADFADEAEVGDHIGVVADDERVVTHRFASKVRGYGGWEFFTTLARAPRSKVITVCESGMLPGENSILAPEWVPWMDRASEEERIRLDAIAAGEDPAKALEDAGYGQEVEAEAVEEPATTAPQPQDEDVSEKNKQARRAAKRRRAKQKAARQKKNKKSGGKDQKAQASKN